MASERDQIRQRISLSVTQNQSLSKELILVTHRILCYGIRLEDGSGDAYAGEYRTVSVVAGPELEQEFAGKSAAAIERR